MRDGSMDEIVKFRVRSDDKEKIRAYFGGFSDMREYVIRVVETKGDDMNYEKAIATWGDMANHAIAM